MTIFSSPLHRIIVLAGVLALGFLCAVLAGALYHNWLPMISAVLFLIAQVPTIIGNQWSSGDFMSESSQTVVDFGRFTTSILTVSGIALPIALYHSNVINLLSVVLTIVGGILIQGTVIGFTSFFEREEELAGFDI